MIVVNQRIFVRRVDLTDLWPAQPAPRDEVIGIDFWHAVEFSRFGRAPSADLSVGVGGNPSKLLASLLGVKSRRFLSEALVCRAWLSASVPL